HANSNQKRAGVAILISGKIGFRSKIITRDKEGHYILTKESIHQQNIAIINIYMPNSRAQRYMKQKLTELKEEI
uniref:Uncharacterized protein n=1 Tax=Equus caballus TaxID=9796 RepID=A0A9L0T273_HORSE